MSLWSRIERRITGLADELIPDEFRHQLAEARQLIVDGKADDAVDVLAALLAERPTHTGALTLLGAAQLELGDGAAAVAAFDGALGEDSALPEALLGRGEACLLFNDAAGATSSFQRAVSHADGDRDVLAEAYRGLGLAYVRLGEVDKAIRELRKAVTENPADTVALAALGSALLGHDDSSDELAERYLRRAVEAEEGDVPDSAWLGLGRLAVRENRYDDAIQAFEKVATESARVDAFLGLGDVHQARGASQEAHRYYLQALELAPKRADIHAGIGDIHASVDNSDAALASYQRSLDLGYDGRVVHRALAVASESDATEAAVRFANLALTTDPNDPQALVARATALASEGQTEPARATFRMVLAQADNLDAHIALGELELRVTDARSAGQAAAASALSALRLDPRNERARNLLTSARARQFVEDERKTATDADTATNADLYNFALRLHDLAMSAPSLSELAPEIAGAATAIDQPLLVTVMGEFSSGKSSFVNAFIGQEVAPTGITPTTATINVVKYGRERGGRILHRNGKIETVAWESLFSVLSGLDPERAKGVETVEILLPLEQLQRVNIVDTPGLNSIQPEHEEVARNYINRADAVVWLFTAMQAGKSSEREALDEIRGEGKRVLGVLNKRDQLADKDIAELVEYVGNELQDRVEAIVPFSARDAMVWRTARPTPEQDGNWAGLEQALETRFFTQARGLKRNAGLQRMNALLARARSNLATRAETANVAATGLRAAADELAGCAAAFEEDAANNERKQVTSDAAGMYERAAAEVLELVIPRRLPFGSHQATQADRDYLISLLDEGYERTLEQSQSRITALFRDYGRKASTAALSAAAVVGGEVVSDLERTLATAIELVSARVFARCQAYLRGYLRGGYVDAFFRGELPKLDLSQDAVYHALFRDSPDLDKQIAVPLARAGRQAVRALSDRLYHWAGVAEVMAYDLEVGVSRALEQLEATQQQLG